MEFDDVQIALCDLEKLIPDAVAQALRDENPDNLLKWLREKLPEYAEPGFWEEAPPGGLNAFAAQCRHLIWNSLPVPGNNFLPRPLPQPGRNDPGPCGSELKYKWCCAALPKPSSPDPLNLWPFVLDQVPKQKLDEALAKNRLPLEGVIAAAMNHLGDEGHEKAVDLLEPLFGGSLKKPRPGLEVALERCRGWRRS
ncbi:MAG: SEC-C domain-containing protein [Deltaproteobacteria bacterium]|nr:SEC-C domain-containing protein [Deltaproteobacteria bacterium]